MPRAKRSEGRFRLNLEMPESVRDKLESMRRRIEADSRTEVIRRALALYDLLLEHSQQGSSIIVRTKDGKGIVVGRHGCCVPLYLVVK